jgi:hypothetical protein
LREDIVPHRQRLPAIRTLIFSLAFCAIVFFKERRKRLFIYESFRLVSERIARRLRPTAVAMLFRSNSALVDLVVGGAERWWSSSNRIPSNCVDELYFAITGRITAHVTSHETEDWLGYFEELRVLAVRVVTNSRLTAAEKTALNQRLIDHVTDLEKLWQTLKMKQNSVSSVANDDRVKDKGVPLLAPTHEASHSGGFNAFAAAAPHSLTALTAPRRSPPGPSTKHPNEHPPLSPRAENLSPGAAAYVAGQSRARPGLH